jgi:hypothetical protein
VEQIVAQTADNKDIFVGSRIWFPSSLVRKKYTLGEVKSLTLVSNGKVEVSLFDLENSKWRNFYSDSLFFEKPKNSRKRRNS